MQGLTTIQAQEFLEKYGRNVIAEQKRESFIIKFIEQFNNFLTILLLLAAGFSFIIGEAVDGGLILAIVILNAFFGLYQESKAEEAIAALRKISVTKIRVIRDGREQEIDSRYLVPQDIIFIEEGVKIPADARMIEARNLEVNEAVLTGESLPVAKKESDEIFMGTIVTRGRGYAEVVATGMQTKFGQIAAELSIIEETKTPLQKKLEDLSRTIGVIGIILSIIVFILSLIQGSGYFPSFLLAISLAVAVVPEGLPAVMTITLSIGVKEMSKRKAIIRKLSAIEALGSITLIATDKTGTLTTNKMQVKEVFVDDKTYEEKGLPSLTNHPFATLVMNGILNSTASLVYVHDHGRFDVLGDPTEGALLFLANMVGLTPEMVRKEWKTINEIPFDSVTKRMTMAVQRANKPAGAETVTYSKGAPESILEISDRIMIGEKEHPLTGQKIKEIEGVLENWARKGLRVLALSYKKGGFAEDIGHQVFLGMVAIYDPPRPEVKEAVRKAKEAGIKIVMITGDNERTAEAIGVTAGIINEGDEILTGKQLEEYSDQELLKVLPKTKVFARTNPFHKYRIVKLFQELGEVVAVTGDGVNDAIALKQSDVGVAMGLIGTDVARETADMVITDDNFATIVNAVEEGRNIIKNLKNAIKYLLSCNISEAFSLIAGFILGLPNLFFAIQFLYINLITDGVPALALAFSPREEGVMKRPPEKEMQLLVGRDRSYVYVIGGLATIVVLVSYYIFNQGSNVLGKTAAFSVLTLAQSFIFVDLWLSHRSIRKNYHKLFVPIFFAAFLVPFVAQFIILNVPFLAGIFRVTTVSITAFIGFIVLSFLVLVGIKGVKRILKY
jgi:Ca2+-transporting ATPase